MPFGVFTDDSRARPMILAFALARDRSLDFGFGFGFGLPKRQPLGRQIDQAARPAQYLAAAICPRTAVAARRGVPARASRRRTSRSGLLYRRHRAAPAAPDHPERRHADVGRL